MPAQEQQNYIYSNTKGHNPSQLGRATIFWGLPDVSGLERISTTLRIRSFNQILRLHTCSLDQQLSPFLEKIPKFLLTQTCPRHNQSTCIWHACVMSLGEFIRLFSKHMLFFAFHIAQQHQQQQYVYSWNVVDFYVTNLYIVVAYFQGCIQNEYIQQLVLIPLQQQGKRRTDDHLFQMGTKATRGIPHPLPLDRIVFG